MKQIRKNTFETNSSSTHSVSICNKVEPQKYDTTLDYDPGDNKVHCRFGEFGWEQDAFRDAQTKLNYLVTMIAQFEGLSIWCSAPWDEYTLNERLMESEDFQKLNDIIEYEYRCRLWVDSSQGYIDHQSYEYYNCIQDFLNDWGIDSMEDFIFNSKVILHTDNDNH